MYLCRDGERPAFSNFGQLDKAVKVTNGDVDSQLFREMAGIQNG
jgi:hypothetical protein